MRLSSQGNQFVFNLPSDFIPQKLIERYKVILEKNHIQYENVIDYLNSTIQSVTLPGISFDLVKQVYPRGKERFYKPAINVQDIITNRELNIDFRSVDSHLNYFIIYDIVNKHYLDVDNLYLNPFMLTCVDIHRDAIYRIFFREIILKSLSDMTFNYSKFNMSESTFTLTFNYNFYDIEFVLDNGKILDL